MHSERAERYERFTALEIVPVTGVITVLSKVLNVGVLMAVRLLCSSITGHSWEEVYLRPARQ